MHAPGAVETVGGGDASSVAGLPVERDDRPAARRGSEQRAPGGAPCGRLDAHEELAAGYIDERLMMAEPAARHQLTEARVLCCRRVASRSSGGDDRSAESRRGRLGASVVDGTVGDGQS